MKTFYIGASGPNSADVSETAASEDSPVCDEQFVSHPLVGKNSLVGNARGRAVSDRGQEKFATPPKGSSANASIPHVGGGFKTPPSLVRVTTLPTLR